MVQFSYRYNMADDVYFSGDEEWERAMVQALDQTLSEGYFSGDEVSDQAMVRSLDQAEKQAAWEKKSKRKHSIISIKHQDNLCCARAIVTTRAWCHRNDRTTWDHMPWNTWLTLRDGYSQQGIMARELHRAAGVPEGPCGLPELEAFQKYLAPTYQLKVISREKPNFDLFYRGPEASNIIRLIKGGDHYDGCKTFKVFFTKRSYWCDQCDKAVSSRRKHTCQGRT